MVESSRLVASRLIERLGQEEEGGAPRLSFDDLHKLIEKALVENDAYDVAKSLVFSGRIMVVQTGIFLRSGRSTVLSFV